MALKGPSNLFSLVRHLLKSRVTTPHFHGGLQFARIHHTGHQIEFDGLYGLRWQHRGDTINNNLGWALAQQDIKLNPALLGQGNLRR